MARDASLERGRRRLRSCSSESRGGRRRRISSEASDRLDQNRGRDMSESDHNKRRRIYKLSKSDSRHADRSKTSSQMSDRNQRVRTHPHRKSDSQDGRKRTDLLSSNSMLNSTGHNKSIRHYISDEKPEKEKPNFAPTGLLAAESNSVIKADGSAIQLKYHEPDEARKPPVKDEWKLFVFKGSEILETIDLNKKSAWLIGRDVSVVDIVAAHPSISKQHAVIQFRYVEKINEFGDSHGKIRPYLIDLKSANGTLLNNQSIPKRRFVELYDKDVIQFVHSSREYVLMLAPNK